MAERPNPVDAESPDQAGVSADVDRRGGPSLVANRPLGFPRRKRRSRLLASLPDWAFNVAVISIPLLIIGGFVAALALWPKPRQRPPPATSLVRGYPETITTKTAFFTFWKNRGGVMSAVPEYAVLNEDEQRDVLIPVEVDAPTGIEVHTTSIALLRKKRTAEFRYGQIAKHKRNVTYDEYAIEGTWAVTAAPNCPGGEHQIQISFPGIQKMCQQLKVAEPGDDCPITIRVKVNE